MGTRRFQRAVMGGRPIGGAQRSEPDAHDCNQLSLDANEATSGV